MKKQNKIVLIISFALLPLGVRAQEPEPQISEDQPISPPPILNGQRPSMAFQSEDTRSNYLSAGINFTDAFTSNAFLSSTDRVSDSSYLIQPHIGFSILTPRLNWDASFEAGWIIHQHVGGGKDQLSKNFVVDLSYRCTRHLDLRLSNTFRDTTGLFSVFNPRTSESGIGIVEKPNYSLLVPPVQQTLANATLVQLSDQFSPNSMAGLRGTYSILDYPGSSQNAQFGSLYATQTYLGEAFYNHWTSPRQWVGVTLRTQRFSTQLSRTDTDSLLFYYAVKAAPELTLSFFAGPEYANTPRISDSAIATGQFPRHLWTQAYGAMLHWQGGHTSVAAEYSRQLSDGGGLSTAVILQGADASLRRQLSRRLEVSLGFTYAVNDPLGYGRSYNGFSGLFEFQQRLVTNLFVRVAYARQRQELPPSLTAVNANLAWISLSYNLLRPLGSGHPLPAGRYSGP